jgi:hypothetical protein
MAIKKRRLSGKIFFIPSLMLSVYDIIFQCLVWVIGALGI